MGIISTDYKLKRDLKIVGEDRVLLSGSVCTIPPGRSCALPEDDNDDFLALALFECGTRVWVERSRLSEI